MKQFWKVLKNNSSEAVNFEPFFDAFVTDGNRGFTDMPSQFYSYNNIESITEYVPVAKITFHDLELYIGGISGISGTGGTSGISGISGWCKVNIEFLTSIPNWEPRINYISCIGEDCRRVYNLHYSRYCEGQDYIIETMTFRAKLLAFYNWGIKSYIPANMCNERVFRRSPRGCEKCEYCREWRDSTSMYDLPKLNDLLNPYNENNIPLSYKIQIIDENIIPSAETISNWKVFLRNERKELLVFFAAIGAKKVESKIALFFRTANNSRPDWLRHLSGY
uniref:Uncharacterized protein n=1 Tax=viral metagenome TaxID=1070528 RepID=A0A6C0HZY5_9ZZZZ